MSQRSRRTARDFDRAGRVAAGRAVRVTLFPIPSTRTMAISAHRLFEEGTVGVGELGHIIARRDGGRRGIRQRFGFGRKSGEQGCRDQKSSATEGNFFGCFHTPYSSPGQRTVPVGVGSEIRLRGEKIISPPWYRVTRLREIPAVFAECLAGRTGRRDACALGTTFMG